MPESDSNIPEINTSPSPVPALLSFKRVAIFAPGLMGGSIALAIEKLLPEIEIIIWGRSKESLKAVLHSGRSYTCTTDILEAAAKSELIILCSPVHTMPELAKRMFPAVQEETIITDVGSTKSWLDEQMIPLFKKKANWCGSHPMTGSEKTGFESATSDLYQNATTILTPNKDTTSKTIASLQQFWQTLGSNVVTLDAQRHDELIAQVSHFPHLLAFLAIHCVEEDALELIGPGFRDFTRIACSKAKMWQEILMDNRQPVIDLIDSYIESLQVAKDHLKTSNSEKLLQTLEKASSIRNSLRTEKK